MDPISINQSRLKSEYFPSKIVGANSKLALISIISKALLIKATENTAFLINLISDEDVLNPIYLVAIIMMNLKTKLMIESKTPINVFHKES